MKATIHILLGTGALLWLALAAPATAADNGMILTRSAHDVATTADRLGDAVKAKGMTVFARQDHAAGAHSVGRELRPTMLLVFGNPKVGSVLMACDQRVGIDLPQKALIWEDAEGAVWLGYNDPAYLADRHGLKDCGAVLGKVGKALAAFAAAATAP